MTHTAHLPQGSLSLLRSILSIPGVLKTAPDYGHGFAVTDRISKAVPNAVAPENEAEFLARMNVEATLELSEAERDLCKRVVGEKVADIPVSIFGIKLLQSLGLCE